MVYDHDRGGVELGQVSDESGSARMGPSERNVCAASVDGNLVDSLHFINDYAQESAFVLENDDMTPWIRYDHGDWPRRMAKSITGTMCPR